MKMIHHEDQLTEDFYVIRAQRSHGSITLCPPVGHEEEFYELIARSQTENLTVFPVYPNPTPATYEYFCRHSHEILRGRRRDWRLTEVGINPYGLLLFKYEHCQTQSVYHLFALPQKSFSFSLELPHAAYGITPPCQITSHCWQSKSSCGSRITIAEFFDTFTRYTRLVPSCTMSGVPVGLLDITEIHGN